MKNGALYENGMSREAYFRQTIDQYAAFDYSDPMTTTDEALFGEWDRDHWTEEPLLDYERVRGLAPVEQAAKAGNYALCRQLILNYYQKKFDSFDFPPVQRPDEKTFLCMEMQMENFFVRPKYGVWPLDKMLVDKTKKWHEADILAAVQEAARAADQRITLHVYALKKDGYAAKFHSRRNEENRPYVTLWVNGEKKIYPAVMDTYLAGGERRRENFGEEKILIAEESYSSIRKEETADAFSRRAVLKFDFSDLKAEDALSEATLHLYGWMEKSENPVESGIEKKSKIVFILNDPTGNLWDEKSLVWQDLDAGGWVCFSYDGVPGYVNQSMLHYFPNLLQYRSSIMAFGHELEFFADCAAADREDAFAYHILRLVMHKTRELHCDFTSTEQPTLNLMRVRTLPWIFEKCRFSPYMTPDIFTVILKSVYEHCEAICGADRFAVHRSRIWTQKLKTANIGSIQTGSMLQAAIAFDEFKAAYAPLGEEWEKDAFNGGWLAVCRDRYQRCMDASFLPDGSVTDIPFNYIFTNLWNYLTPMAEWEKQFHFDMGRVFTREMIQRIIRVCEYAARIISPLSGGWQIGDASSHRRKQLSYMQDLKALFPNLVSEHLKYIVSEGKEGRPARETAMVSEGTSRAVIRSDWTREAVALHFQSNSHFAHTHNDDLSVTLMAYGNYLLADPTRYLYVVKDAISNWQISRAAHSSILIDETEPEKAGGSLHPEDRALNEIYDFLHGDSRGYKNILQERYICFVRPGYFIVTDRAAPEDQKKHSYRQGWHFQPDAAIRLSDAGNTETHYRERANLAIAPAAEKGELTARICTGFYSQAAQQTCLENYQYAVYEKEAEGNAAFQTLLYPIPAGKTARVEAQTLPCSQIEARAMHGVIAEDGEERVELDYLLCFEKKEAEVHFGPYVTDGSMAMIERQHGCIRTLILRNGSFIRHEETGEMLVRLSRKVQEWGISRAHGERKLVCSCSTAQILEGLI